MVFRQAILGLSVDTSITIAVNSYEQAHCRDLATFADDLRFRKGWASNLEFDVVKIHTDGNLMELWSKFGQGAESRMLDEIAYEAKSNHHIWTWKLVPTASDREDREDSEKSL